MAALSIILFFAFVVGLVSNLLTQPLWSMQWTISVVVLLGLIYRMVTFDKALDATKPQLGDYEHTTGEREYDDPMNISPAERVRRLDKNSEEESDHQN